MITKYGRREIALATVLAGAVAAAMGWLFAPAVVVPVAAWLAVLWFFRDPNRTAPAEDNVFVSPADGRVSDVTQVGSDSDLGRPGVRIGVFMSVFDVHVNRSPCAGRVESVTYCPGRFLDARDPAAGDQNESATIRLLCQRDGATHPVIVRQVAGLIARRIVTDVKIGQDLATGQRLGMIKFGSRVELIAPVELAGEVRVGPGQKVRAGQTVLLAARRRSSDG
ncbi:MAG: phosphatidylserine decarboxylase [Phycisphaerae bacterium]|nr:phosphatidylserine decarboxylase [Phycisphaerae bacterium]